MEKMHKDQHQNGDQSQRQQDGHGHGAQGRDHHNQAGHQGDGHHRDHDGQQDHDGQDDHPHEDRDGHEDDHHDQRPQEHRPQEHRPQEHRPQERQTCNGHRGKHQAPAGRDLRKRRRSLTIRIEHARMEDVFDINRLCHEAGDGNVDVRDIYDTVAAIQEGRFHLLLDHATGEIVGCISIYSYPAGDRQLNELGTLIVVPAYRKLGIADFAVSFSCICSMLADPGSICVGELYHDSVSARTVLERNGMRQVNPCHWRISHANTSPRRPVIHMELGYGPIPVMAGQLLVWLNGGATARNGVKVSFLFGDGYWLNTEAGREVLRQLSRGDLRAIRDSEEEESLETPQGSPPPSSEPTNGRRNRPN